MAERLEFKEKLSGILELAESQGGKITLEEVEKFFEEDKLSQEQIDLVCEYLMSQQIAVTGYAKREKVIKEGETKEKESSLSQEEQIFVEDYLRDIGALRKDNREDARLAYYLPKVVEEAIRLHHQEVFIGDLIQEGSVSLVMALNSYDGLNSTQGGIPGECFSGCEKDRMLMMDETAVMEEVRAGMMALVESQAETRRRDRKMVERVSNLEETIKAMTEEQGRKVAIDEVAERLGVTEDEIEDILKLAGEEVTDEDL